MPLCVGRKKINHQQLLAIRLGAPQPVKRETGVGECPWIPADSISQFSQNDFELSHIIKMNEEINILRGPHPAMHRNGQAPCQGVADACAL